MMATETLLLVASTLALSAAGHGYTTTGPILALLRITE